MPPIMVPTGPPTKEPATPPTAVPIPEPTPELFSRSILTIFSILSISVARLPLP